MIANVFDPKAVLEDVKVKAAEVPETATPPPELVIVPKAVLTAWAIRGVLSSSSPGLCSRYRVND